MKIGISTVFSMQTGRSTVFQTYTGFSTILSTQTTFSTYTGTSTIFYIYIGFSISRKTSISLSIITGTSLTFFPPSSLSPFFNFEIYRGKIWASCITLLSIWSIDMLVAAFFIECSQNAICSSITTMASDKDQIFYRSNLIKSFWPWKIELWLGSQIQMNSGGELIRVNGQILLNCFNDNQRQTFDCINNKYFNQKSFCKKKWKMVEVKIIVLRVINFWNFIGGNLVWLRKRVLIKIMFGNAYQNGHIFEVWDSKVNPEKNQLYKQLFRMIPASIKKYFDKDVKSYIYSLQGQVSKMCLPANDQKQLSLHQKYVVFHVFIPHGSTWSMELGITDISNCKRRINITSTQGKQEIKYFSLRYPLNHLERGVWLFLGVNIYSFMEAFKDQVFRSLDHITVGSNCSIRRIFTMKQWNHMEIPKSYWFPGQIPQEFQLIEYTPPSSLPKINLSKGSMIYHNYSEQPVTSLYEKLTPNKIQSKLALGKSEVSPSRMTKSKVHQMKPMSLEPIVNLHHSPESKQIKNSKIKLRLNSMKDEAHTSIIKKEKTSKLQDNNLFKKQRQKQIRISQREHEEPVKSKIKKSVHKSPILEKSFQEDQGLEVHQSSNNFETSHETIVHKNFATLTKSHHIEQKWTSSQGEQKKQVGRSHQSPKMHKKQQKQGRTELIMENHEVKKKVIQGGKKQEIELIYDEMVGCYYHPETHMYYEIKN